MEYVIHGRYHRIAFLRRYRVVDVLVKDSRAVMSNLFHYVSRAEAERVFDYSNRLLKTWIFLLSAFIVVIFVALLVFLGIMSSVFFKSMVLWRGLGLNFDFMATMLHAVQSMASFMHLPFLQYMFVPFIAILTLLSSFEIDLSAVNVTCKGASAPLELFINLIIMGITIIVIESDFQLFRAITFNSITDKFIQAITMPGYKDWAIRNNGKSAIPTKLGKSRFLNTVLMVLFSRGFGGVDFIQSMLQYMMSYVNLASFAADNGKHFASPECNGVKGFENFDDYIAAIATAEAWFLIFPTLYEIAKVLVPGLPTGTDHIEDTDNKRDPKSSLLHAVKYTSFLAPDLWISSMASSWIDVVKANTPLSFGVNTVQAQENEGKDYSKRQSMHGYIKKQTSKKLNRNRKKLVNNVDNVRGMKELELGSDLQNLNDFKHTDEPKSPATKFELAATPHPFQRGKGRFFQSESDKSDKADKAKLENSPVMNSSIDENAEEDEDEDEDEEGIWKDSEHPDKENNITYTPGRGRSDEKQKEKIEPHMQHEGDHDGDMQPHEHLGRQFANGFKVVSRGTNGVTLQSEGFYLARYGYSRHVWNVHSMRILESGYHVVRINRESGEIELAEAFDLGDPDDIELMCQVLDESTFEHLICVFTTGNPASHRKNKGSGGRTIYQSLYVCCVFLIFIFLLIFILILILILIFIFLLIFILIFILI